MSPTFEVRIAPHGKTLQVNGGETVLDAALRAGLNLPHSCKSGHCTSCRARLLAGEIHYPNGRPLGLSDEEARSGQVLLCQARPRSALTVEARLFAGVGDVEIKTLPVRIARLCCRLRPTQQREQILRHESRDLDWYSSLVLLFRIVEGSKNRAGESALGGR